MAGSMSRQQWGKIEGLRVEGTSDTAVVLFHGYGASAEDLFPLSQINGLAPGAHWFFPNGVLEIPIGPGMSGRAWFALDMSAIERAMMTGTFLDYSDKDPEVLATLNADLAPLFDLLKTQFKKVFIGGFSQGGMVAINAVLSQSWTPHGLIALSTSLLAKQRWDKLLENHKSLRVFQAHGLQDAVLHPQGAENLAALWSAHEIEAPFHRFQGGHDIPPGVLLNLSKFIQGEPTIVDN